MVFNFIYGKFQYNEKVYPFVLANHVITIVQLSNEFNSDFSDVSHFDYLKGVTNNNTDIFFLDCDLVSSSLIRFSSSIRFVCKGYVLATTSEDFYDYIEFSSPALNGFYSPRQAIKLEHDDERFCARGLIFKNCEDTAQDFSCTINGEHINCTLTFRSSVTLKAEDSSIGSVNTVLSMEFVKSISVTDLSKYYLYVQDFLVFANFRSDIPMDDIILYKIENGNYEKCGTAKFFQRDCSQYSPDNFCSISYDDLPNEYFSKIFSAIAERREQGCHNPFFIPLDGKDARYFDSAKWLITAISFEGEFDRRFPDFKYKTDAKFKAAKDLLLKTINDAVSASGFSINNPINTSLKSFRRLVSHTDTTIREKFQLCMDRYRNEITPLVEKYTRIKGISEDTNFAQAYADYHNTIAHGTILPISKTEIVTYQLMRCFIYILILEYGGVPNEKIKEIITRMF